MPQQYTIAGGDTLGGIAARYGLNYMDLARLNNISDPNRIYAGQTLNLTAPQQQAQPQSNIVAPATRQAFSSILPQNFLDPLIQQLAESQVMPEVQRQKETSLADYYRSSAGTGGYRSGVGLNQKSTLNDYYTRQGAEQTGQFFNSIKNNVSDYYNQLYTDYNKNPSAFVAPKIPDYNTFIQQNPNLLNAYNTATGANTYKPIINY